MRFALRHEIVLLTLATLLAIVLLTLPAHGQTAGSGYTWEQSTENPVYWALRFDGVQVGIFSSASGLYRPYDATADNFSDPVDIPIDPPVKATAGDWRTTGVLSGSKPTGLTFGGGDTAEPVPMTGDAPAAGDPTPAPNIPDYGKLGSWTVVAKDKKTAQRVVDDLKTAPALADWKAAYAPRARAYSADSFALKPFKLSEDKRFQESGVVILVQPAPDANDAAPVQKIYGYEGPEQLNARLHEINIKYDPNAPDEAETGWTRTNVGLGVGGGVTALFSLILGGLIKWRS